MFFNRMIFVSVCIVFLVGCESMPIPSSIESINATLFESPKDLEERAVSLEQGMTEERVLEVLGMSDEMPNLEYLDDVSIYNIIYAGAEIRGTPDEIEEFRKELLTHNYTGWSIPYTFVKSNGYLERFHYVTTSYEGFNLRVVIIFENGTLYKKPGVYGVKKIQSTNSSSFIWKAIQSVPDRTSGLIKF